MVTTQFSALVTIIIYSCQVIAHGYVQGIVADGVDYTGYDPSLNWQNPPPVLAAWGIPEDADWGFVTEFNNPDIICHKGASPGQLYVTVAAGSKIDLQWTQWPEGHKGPVMDYLANCNGDCTKVQKTKLLWNKIDESGLLNGDASPGTWASDTMIANNNTWTTTIPSSIAPGNYVLRHETIALHQASTVGGAQNYPQCINLKVTGSGSNKLTTGTLGTSLYHDGAPGLLINLWQSTTISNYTIPGPTLMQDAASPAVSSSESSSPNTPSISTSMPVPTTLQTVTRTVTVKVTVSATSTLSSQNVASSAIESNVVIPIVIGTAVVEVHG